MKKFLKLFFLLAAPVMFVQQCNTVINSCSTSETGLLGVTQLRCYESVDLTEADCTTNTTGGVFAAAACNQTLYTKQCTPLVWGLTVDGKWYTDGMMYYGGTDTIYVEGAAVECTTAVGSLSNL